MITAEAGADARCNASVRLALARPYYRPEFELLRFAAFALVFISHSIWLHADSPRMLVAVKASGKLGVPLFFMLSAFLITELLQREKTLTGSLNVRAFYVRRILRIWPIYLLMLVGGFIFLHLLPGKQVPLLALMSYLFFAGNWYTIVFGPLPPGMGPLWSISVEEQFYLLWPTVMRVASRKHIWLVAVCAWLISQVTVAWLCSRFAPIWWDVWLNSFVHLQYFAIGIAMSIWLAKRRRQLTYVERCSLVALGLALVFAVNYFLDTSTQVNASLLRTYPGYLVTGIAAALLLEATYGASIPRMFAPFRWLGKVSYGLYVYHVSCCLLSILLCARAFHVSSLTDEFVYASEYGVALPLTILFAALSYRYIEAPFLRLKRRFEIVKSRAI